MLQGSWPSKEGLETVTVATRPLGDRDLKHDTHLSYHLLTSLATRCTISVNWTTHGACEVH